MINKGDSDNSYFNLKRVLKGKLSNFLYCYFPCFIFQHSFPKNDYVCICTCVSVRVYVHVYVHTCVCVSMVYNTELSLHVFMDSLKQRSLAYPVSFCEISWWLLIPVYSLESSVMCGYLQGPCAYCMGEFLSHSLCSQNLKFYSLRFCIYHYFLECFWHFFFFLRCFHFCLIFM